jgi:hypothetical protein
MLILNIMMWSFEWSRGSTAGSRSPMVRVERRWPPSSLLVMIRHFGMFQFKEGVSEAQIDECFAQLRGMVGKIPGLLGIEHGPYESDEGLNDGFSHGFIMSFDSAASRDAYLPHEEHERVRDLVVPCLERVVVFDFDAG